MYLGIQQQLEKYLLNKQLKREILKAKNFRLIFNVDGIPISRSSNNQFWPILCKLYLKNHKLTPFPVAIYCGISKPPSLSLYLREFVAELNRLILSGLRHDDVILTVSVICFTCDAPARAFMKNIKGHNSLNGCERCVEKGVHMNRRIVYKNHNCQLRTYNSFKNFTDINHHKSDTHSPVVEIAGFDPVSQFTLDYLHLCCLGVMRKLLNYWCKKDSFGNRKVLLSLRLRKILSGRMTRYAKCIPTEFARKPRSLKDLDRFKGTEFRLFLLYLGPIVLKKILPKDLYDHFLLFHCSIRILCNHELFSKNHWLEIAQQMLVKFVKLFSKFYGQESCVFNVHSLIHLVDDVKNTKLSLNELSCFSFESYLGSLVAQLRRFNRPLQQIVKRLSEKQHCNVVFDENIHNLHFRSVGIRDCYAFLKKNHVLKITHIENNTVVGYLSSKLHSFYHIPVNSKDIGLYKFVTFSEKTTRFTITDISCKVLVLKMSRVYVAVKLLHAKEF